MRLKSIVTASITAFALAITTTYVQASTENTHSTQALMLASNQSHYGTGTVTAIDNKNKKVELKHGPIKSIGWMGMKMFFDVDDAELLDEIEVNDKVDFEFIETRDKRYVITDIEAQ